MSAVVHDHPFPLTASAPRSRLWAGRVLSAIAIVFLAMDTVMKLAATAPAVQAMPQLGFRPELLLPIGLIELACVTLYAVPRTAPLGAVLLTGYLGGAIATHLRLGNPLLTHVLFPIYVAAFAWGGLYLRDPRVRAAVRALR